MKRGFTLLEALAVLWMIFVFSLVIGVIWVAVHFISKYW